MLKKAIIVQDNRIVAEADSLEEARHKAVELHVASSKPMTTYVYTQTDRIEQPVGSDEIAATAVA